MILKTTTTMLSWNELGAFVLVGALWGCTNPLLRAGSQSEDSTQKSKPQGFFAEIKALLTNWRFLLPFALNQCGSVAYVATLGSSAISMAMPICNSLALFFNCVTSRLMGEQALTLSTRLFAFKFSKFCSFYH
jgi:hypothetical protein